VGPTLLRQAGFLDDQDEFQKHAAAAASTYAFVASVVVATAVLVAKAWKGPLDRDPDAWLWLILFGVVLAVLSRRFPRSVGVLLVGFAIAGAFFFHVFTPRPTPRGWSGPDYVVLFLLLPLALTGVGLLGARPEREEEP
jgi:hypothetical protein